MEYKPLDTSRFLSKALGIYLIVISLAFFLRMQDFKTNIFHLMQDAPLMLVVGFFTLIVGLLMVLCHNVWQFNWRVIVTLVSWLVLLKGVSILIFPQLIDSITLLFLNNHIFSYVCIAILLILGFLLTYFGFRRDAN